MDASRIRLFGSPDSSTTFLAVVLEAFRLAPVPAFLEKRFTLSQTSDPLQRPRSALPSCCSMANHRTCRSGSSHEVLCPFSVRVQASRLIARFPPDAIPPRSFADPRGLDPHSSLRPCFMPLPLMGLLPFKAFPRVRTLPGSSPGDPLSMFLRRPYALRRVTSVASPGGSVRPRTGSNARVLHLTRPRCSHGLSRLHGFRAARGGTDSRRLIRS